MSGVLSVHQVRATFYRFSGEPLIFGMDSTRALNSSFDLLECSIERRINAPASVSLTLPARAGTGAAPRWSDLISPGDWLQIDAMVARNPSDLGDPWRTVFFGYVDDATEDFSVAKDVEDTTAITATCQLGWLESNFYNYWINVSLETARQAANQPSDQGVSGGGSNNTAALLESIFERRIYQAFPGQRRVRGVGQTRWRDTHALRFESDAATQAFTTVEFAPHASSFLQAVQALVDIPAFFQMYCDVIPQTRISTGVGVSEGAGNSRVVRKKQSGLIFPDNGLLVDSQPRSAATVKVGSRVDAIIIRPLPFPEYHANGGYDSLAWDRLPTIAAREELGEISRTLARSRKSVFTYYMTTAAPGTQGTGPDTSFDLSSVQSNILDDHKYQNLFGYQICAAQTKRLNTSLPDASVAKTDPTYQAAVTDLTTFYRGLNETLLSFYQFADRFKTGQVTTPLDLRLELGARYLFDNLGRMGFVDGYRHTFSPSEASTQVSLTRVLPLGVYQNEYRRTLGRKRDDEPLAPKFLVEGNYRETQLAGER